jgi:hypothetical protein
MEKIAQENALLSKDLESLIRQAATRTTVTVSTSYMQMYDYTVPCPKNLADFRRERGGSPL